MGRDEIKRRINSASHPTPFVRASPSSSPSREKVGASSCPRAPPTPATSKALLAHILKCSEEERTLPRRPPRPPILSRRPSSSATATATRGVGERRWVTTLSVCVAHTFEALLDKHWSTQFLFLPPPPFPSNRSFCNRRLSSLFLSLFSACLRLFLYVGKEICRQLFLLLFEGGILFSSLLARTQSFTKFGGGGRRYEAFAGRTREELSIPFLHLVSFLLHSEIRRSFTNDFSGK